MKLSAALCTILPLPFCHGLTITGRDGPSLNTTPEPGKRGGLLQDVVRWDEHSLFIRGERAMMFSGEYHPFRLPVQSLHLDVFQKIKALGFNMVSFYVDWALLEARPGEFEIGDIFDLEPFFEAAKKAGIYLLARPGPYINAEVSGGGLPGWLQRIRGVLRTDVGDFLASTDNYMARVCAIIAKHQITNGGPVVLFQPENEYSYGYKIPFPNGKYMQYVIDQARRAGIVVPMINNDVGPLGNYAPGSGAGAMDIYGHDGYPLGFDCGKPSTWPADKLPTNFRKLHLQHSPNTPFSIVEFQGGSFDPWGGCGLEQCSALINHEFARVYYKNNFAAGATILNLYMIFGGTNWGNLGHPGGYTSYDYGACIRENRVVDREKYSEVKLEGEFLKVSPGYLIAVPGDLSTSTYSDNAAIAITPLRGNKTGSFFVARHADYASTETVSYKLKLPTAVGTIIVPQGGGSLTLSRRDSKIHVTDYPVGPDHTLLYSSAEIFTWKKFGAKTVLIMYGGLNETHEFACTSRSTVTRLEGNGYFVKRNSSMVVVQWKASSRRQVVEIGSLAVYMLDRNAAYNYWVPVLPSDHGAYGSSVMSPEAVIINGGYLVRSVSIDGATLSLQADFNKTTAIEIIGVPEGVSRLRLNGRELAYRRSRLGNWVADPEIHIPEIPVPDLTKLDWRRVDSLPEIQPGYDDSPWPVANLASTNNTAAPLQTPVSLYGSDYGFNTGTLLFRGYFTARGSESRLELSTQGGSAYASSVWLNHTFLGVYKNPSATSDNKAAYPVPHLTPGARYVLTILVDSTGLSENFNSGHDDMKSPRGILSYALVCSDASRTSISPWKVTGNLGGESYRDRYRGPLNEGGLFFERMGYHYPSPPLDVFDRGSPFAGVGAAGVAFYVAQLQLDYPADRYDIPFSFVFDSNATAGGGGDYRAMLFVNGFQYGRYVSNIGPQTDFPVPEGILDYRGENWIGLAVWALDKDGARVPGLRLKAGTAVVTGREEVHLTRGPKYAPRRGAY